MAALEALPIVRESTCMRTRRAVTNKLQEVHSPVKSSRRPLRLAGLGVVSRNRSSLSAPLDSLRKKLEDFDELEAHWQVYLESNEFLTFRAVVECLIALPPLSQLAERRADFELLIHLLHSLGEALQVDHVSKSYRAHYSPDVQLTGYLYSTLLTAFTLLPSYILNGQEFFVSSTVLDQCQSLQEVFRETCQELRRQFDSLQPYSVEPIREEVRRSLVYFDRSWCRFEMPALEEIEAIHKQACRPLLEAIEVEKALTDFEQRGVVPVPKNPGRGAQKVRMEVQRSRLMEKICELNRLANLDGKGRSDMDLTCVLEAERLTVRPFLADPDGRTGKSASASALLYKVAQNLLRCFGRLRRVLRRYGRCLYQLNSHLANNADLVRALELFEAAWETANRYLVQPGPRRLALHTYEVLSSIAEREFQEALTCLDPGFLVATLPRALLFLEMQRAVREPLSLAPLVPAAKKAAKVSPVLLSTSTAPDLLPQKLRDAVLRGPSLDRSPLAKAFLPKDHALFYNQTADLVQSLTEVEVGALRKSLFTESSSLQLKTPTPMALNRRASPLPQRGSTGGRGRSGGCQAERPPATPCPPRMAVPNSSRPTTGKAGSLSAPSPVPNQKEAKAEDSDEDDVRVLSLELISLQEDAEEVTLPLRSLAASPVLPRKTSPLEGERREESRVREIMSSISVLSVRLQREKPADWNELLQVVIQGLVLERHAHGTDGSHLSHK